MRNHLISASFLIILSVSSLRAADITPAQADQDPNAGRRLSQFMSVGPNFLGEMASNDVESVLIPAASAARIQAMSTWAELAARGFRVVGTSSIGDSTLVLLERSTPLTLGKPYVPQIVTGDVAASNALSGRLQSIRDERQRAMQAEMSQWQSSTTNAGQVSQPGIGSITPLNGSTPSTAPVPVPR